MAADTRMNHSIVHTEENERMNGSVLYGQSITDDRSGNYKVGQPRSGKYRIKQDFERRGIRDHSAEAIHSGEYSSISSNHKQNLHLNKLMSIYRTGNQNSNSVNSQSRFSNINQVQLQHPNPQGHCASNNGMYQSSNAANNKVPYPSKIQPKSVYRTVKRKLKSGDKKVTLADIVLANNYLSGDLNLKCEYSESGAAQQTTAQNMNHSKNSNFSNSMTGLVQRPLDENHAMSKHQNAVGISQLSGSGNIREKFNTEASQSSLSVAVNNQAKPPNSKSNMDVVRSNQVGN